MAKLARRSNARVARAPSRRRAIVRRAAATIVRTSSAAMTRAKESTRTRALLIGAVSAGVGGVIDAQLITPWREERAAKEAKEAKEAGKAPPEATTPIPAQLVIGGATVALGLAMDGKIAESIIFAGMGPLFAGVSDLSRSLAKPKPDKAQGTALEGEFDGGPYGFGGSSTVVAGEFDDIV